MISLALKCPSCSGDMTLVFDPICPIEWCERMAKGRVCNACYDRVRGKPRRPSVEREPRVEKGCPKE